MTKPFARIEGSTLVIGDEATLSVYEADGSLEELAAAINTDLEAREAKLRVRIDSLRVACADFINVIRNVGPIEQDSAVYEHIRRVYFETVEDPEDPHALSAVSGDVACGLAFDLGVMRGHFSHSWQMMLDRLMESGGQSSELALALADHLGVKLRPHMYKVDRDGNFEAITVTSMTDAELRAECWRRGMIVEPPGARAPSFLDVARQPLDDWRRAVIDRLAERPPELPTITEQMMRYESYRSPPPIVVSPDQYAWLRTDLISDGSSVSGQASSLPPEPQPCPNCGRTDRGCGPSGVIAMGGVELNVCRSMGPNEDPILRQR